MREQIIEIAEKQMLDGGYENLNFAGIASQLGITRASIHYHFQNKETLALKAAEKFAVEREAEVEKIASLYSDNFPKFVSALEAYFFSFARKSNLSTCLCSQILRQSDAPDVLFELAQNHMFKLRDVCEQVVKNSLSTGKLSSKFSAGLISKELTLIIGGINMTAQLFRRNPELAEKELGSVLSSWVKKFKN